MSQLRAGTAEADITPRAEGTWLLGPIAPSTGVHDPLFARALVLDDGQTRAAILTLDLVGLSFELVDRIRAEVSRRTGLHSQRVMLNCSHTHSAPFSIPWSVQGWDEFTSTEAGWADRLVEKTAEIVQTASHALEPVHLSSGRAPVQIGANRRLPTDDGVMMAPNPDGPAVPWVDVLAAHREDGFPKAVLFSHAAHPVIVHASSTLMSADYCGFAVDSARRSLGPEVLAMFAQGCGADVNGQPLRGGFEAAREAGQRLGEATVKAVAGADQIRCGALKMTSETAMLPLEAPPPVEDCRELYEQAREDCRALIEKHDQRATDPSASGRLWAAKDLMLRYEELLHIAESETPAGSLRFELQTLSLGDDFCLLVLTHEVFSEYQLHALSVSPFRHTMVLGYTNGCESYLPTDEALLLGGYEASSDGAALAYRHRLRPAPGVEALVEQHLSDALHEAVA